MILMKVDWNSLLPAGGGERGRVCASPSDRGSHHCKNSARHAMCFHTLQGWAGMHDKCTRFHTPANRQAAPSGVRHSP